MLAELAGDEAAAALLRDAAQPALGPPLGWLLLEVVASHPRQIPSKFSTVGDKVFTAVSRQICTARPMSVCGSTDHFCCMFFRTYDWPIVVKLYPKSTA